MTAAQEHRFAVGSAPTVEVRLGVGTVRVVDGAEGAVAVEISGPAKERFRVDQHGDTVMIEPEQGVRGRWRAHHVVVRVPGGTTLRGSLATADLDVLTTLAEVDVESASGGARMADVSGTVRVRSASGDVRADRVGGGLVVRTASADVRAASVSGRVRVHTASGDVRIGQAADDVEVKTASGDIDVVGFAAADLDCATMSGDVRVGLAPGMSVVLDLHTLSGDVRHDFPADTDGGQGTACRVAVRTMSGDITLQSAPVSA